MPESDPIVDTKCKACNGGTVDTVDPLRHETTDSPRGRERGRKRGREPNESYSISCNAGYRVPRGRLNHVGAAIAFRKLLTASVVVNNTMELYFWAQTDEQQPIPSQGRVD